jgi:hypothetical protein
MTARRAMRLLPLCIGLACAPALAETIAIVDA